jgi:hypothetical protein
MKEGVSRSVLPIMIGLLICCVIFVLAVRASKNYQPEISTAAETAATSESAQPTKAAVTAALSSQSAEDDIEVELITIKPYGFDQKEITRPKGPFFLAIDNRSMLPVISLSLVREAGNSQHQVRIPRAKADSISQLNLTPGRYLLKEANQPDWICRITVTP